MISLFPFEVLAQGIHAIFPEQCAELHISAAAFGKILPIGLAEGADQGIAMLAVDFAVGVPPTAIKV